MDIFLVFQRPLHWLIVNLTDVTHNYGLAIILFTIIIRTILAPLYIAQIKSSRKMMELSPKIKELQKKYGKDREALTRETMALYKDHNHNPALGCVLPLVQIPILWSLFLVLRDIATKHEHLHDVYTASFLWLHNLGNPDQFHILPIVAGITQWIQQRMMLQPTNDPQQRQMNQIMQFLPLMIVVFAWSYPSGLAVYWVTANIFMIVMQYLISGWGQLFTSPLTIPTVPGGGTAAPAASPGGSFLARALAPRAAEATAPSSTPRVRPQRDSAPAASATTSDARVETTDDERSGKMERYAARHNRGVSRGRPSAKGAKK